MRKKIFDIPNIVKQIATQQLTVIGKVAHNYDDHIPVKLLTVWCNHKRLSGGVLHTNKKSIIHNLHPIIHGVEKTVVLITWIHFSLNDKYWKNLISGLRNP